jgi:hypothetical protein
MCRLSFGHDTSAAECAEATKVIAEVVRSLAKA